MKNPWVNITPSGQRTVTADSAKQLELVAKFDAEKLIEVIKYWATPPHVKTAARQRLKQLFLEAAK